MRQGPDTASKTFVNPLPGDQDAWDRCSLGPASEWPESLQLHSLTLSTLPYPTAIYWGEQLILLHNQEWAGADGLGQQGRSQRGSLDPDVLEAMDLALHGGRPREVRCGQLLRNEADTKARNHTVLLSPLFANGLDTVAGLMVQLIPRQKPGRSQTDGPSVPGRTRSFGNAQLDARVGHNSPHGGKWDQPAAIDNVPLDEHPFFHRFAEMLPSGLAILNHKAQAIFVNKHFYDLTTHHGPDQSFQSWPDSIETEDKERVLRAYREAFESQRKLRTEFRTANLLNPWRLLLLMPLGEENLPHVSLKAYGGFICSIVDISSEKSAELGHRQAARDERERTEQQGKFIDMISHEIRNPLSAILHCSEDIEDAIKVQPPDLDTVVEAVKTINLCISHQKNIVDDVLSFSKLDAAILSLKPQPCRPSLHLAESLKMFQPELRKQGMMFDYSVDTSYVDHKVTWVMSDLSRINQVLINIVSNAIKFTSRSEGERKIAVSIGASRDRPTSYPLNIVSFETEDSSTSIDVTNDQAWGQGEVLYILVAVKDSGIGISEIDQAKLFQRFRQATPKTEKVYGGSGLGLNISRKICHLHGGEIGVSSREKQGSTFGFFFRAKRTKQRGDYDGLPDDEGLGAARLQNQVEVLGNETPANVDSTLVPRSLKSPPITGSDRITPHGSGEKGDRSGVNAKMAKNIEDVEEKEKENRMASQDHQERRKSTSRAGAEGREASAQSESALQVTSHRSANTSNDANTGRHILLVEDNVVNQRIVSRKLASKGFAVTTANNGREAVTALQNSLNPSSGDVATFDVILMDQKMPVMDGNAATKAIRDIERKEGIEHVPILGVTANVREEQQDEMREAGMDDVISKPYKTDAVIAKIDEMIGVGTASTKSP